MTVISSVLGWPVGVDFSQNRICSCFHKPCSYFFSEWCRFIVGLHRCIEGVLGALGVVNADDYCSHPQKILRLIDPLRLDANRDTATAFKGTHESTLCKTGECRLLIDQLLEQV